MIKLYKTMLELLQQGESFVVATIFDKSGSAPRADGAKMVVRADGSIVGTIGGGRLEAGAIDLAREIVPTRKTVIQSFDLTSKDITGDPNIYPPAELAAKLTPLQAHSPDFTRLLTRAWTRIKTGD